MMGRGSWVFVGAGVALIAVGGVVWSMRGLNRPAKTYALSSDILIHGNQQLREVAFTFDDGPRPEIVREMLNVLGKYRARSTFFVVGAMVEKHPAIVRRMMNEGHEVANHTYSHPRLAGLTEEQIRDELARCDKAVFDATGARTNLFRPPGMRYDDTVLRAAQSLGYVTIHWNTAAQDYQPQPPSEISRKILKSVRPGSVILLHNHPDTLAALPMILDSLTEQGYRLVTVSQMLSRLERPVVVKTNAYGAKPPALIEVKPKVVVKRPVRRVTKRPTTTPTPPAAAAPRGLDMPAWN